MMPDKIAKIFLLLFILCSEVSNAQAIVHEVLTPTVGDANLRIYYGVENSISIIKEGHLCNEMEWYYKGQKLKKDQCKYFITPSDTDYIDIYNAYNDTLTFFPISLPSPSIYVYPYRLHYGKFYPLYSLECLWPAELQVKYTIRSFEIELCEKGKSLYFEKCYGNSISPKVNDFLKDNRAVDEVVFHNIIIDYSDFFSQKKRWHLK